MKSSGPSREISLVECLAKRSTDSAIDVVAVGDLLRRLTGISLREGKRELIESRLRRKALEVGLDSVKDYLARLEDSPIERQQFINLMTTNESRLFRTERIWQYLEQAFLPAWWEQYSGRRLQIWSGAAASGQEAYSLVMLCQEFGSARAQSHGGARKLDYRIWASDIDTAVLASARRGWYVESQWQGIRRYRPLWFDRYARAEGEGYAVAESLKANVEFSQHNLLKAWPTRGHFDLVLLRNVLIYFEAAEQLTVLRHVLEALRPGGTLILGEAESLGQVEGWMAKEKLLMKYVAPQIYARPLVSVEDLGGSGKK